MRLILLEKEENCESDAGASVESIFRHYLAKSVIARRVAAKSFRSHRRKAGRWSHHLLRLSPCEAKIFDTQQNIKINVSTT